ncbi:MAG: hypothetical protein AB7S75_23285 [Desulfococcaceae bacterium]
MEHIMKNFTVFICVWLISIISCLIWISPENALADLPEAVTAPGLSSSDSDGDGLPDWWEERYGGNLAQGNDSDADGVSNLNEYNNGTHPLETDTDGDGINDYDEIYRYGTEPLLADTDRGGNTDGYEITSGGSPLNPDDDDAPGEVFSISLQKGWNLFSIPVTPADTSIASVLSPIAGKYVSVLGYQDGKWPVYKPPLFATLKKIEAGAGYWIEMKENAILNVSGSPPGKSISLSAGWNMVGYNSAAPQKTETAFSSVTGKIITVWIFMNNRWLVYNPENPIFTSLFTVQPGYGYWIEVKEDCDCTWTLP